MNEQEREHVDSLIHGFLDGQLNERQQTELKRLAQHNPFIRKDLHALFRQKELLGFLPIEKAPNGLKEEVLARLERRLILSMESPRPSVRTGRFVLLVRWVSAAAAMVMLPLAILGLLVLQIVKPPEPKTVPVALTAPGQTAEPLQAGEGTASGEGPVLVLGTLTFLTEHPIPLNESIKKAVVAHKLLSSASSERFEDRAVYRIQCSQRQMLSLIQMLRPVWELSSKPQFVLAGGESPARTVVVEGIRPEQMEKLIRQSSPSRLQMTASHLERLNRRGLSDVAIRVPAEETGEGERILLPAEPRLAWEKEPTELPGGMTADGPAVVLVIEVRSPSEKK